MKYKMIISDYGETLVHTGSSVDTRNIEAINAYQEQGGIFCIATGREWSSISQKIRKSILNSLKEIPVICCYGSAIVLSKSAEVILEKGIDEQSLNKVSEYLDQNAIPFSVSTIDKTCSLDVLNVNLLPWKRHSEQFIFASRELMLKYLKENNNSVLKIEVQGTESGRLATDFINNEMPGSFKYFPSKEGFVEIINFDAGKGNATQFLSRYYNIPMENLVVVGDAPNDLEMFDVAINKFAVSNAIDSIISASNSVIDNSNYLGISRLIKDIMGGSLA